MLRARPGASVHAGNKDGVTREVFEQALMDRSTIKCMVEHEVEAGDGFLLHAGMMHYSKGGVIFYEIMQNSDITIGLRGVPEDLPEEERRQRAKELTDLVHLEDGCNCKTTPRSIDLGDGNTHTFIFACRYFSLERFDLAKPMEMEVNGGRFCVLSQVYGQSDVIWGDSKETLRTGQSCLLPASLGSVRIEPGPDAALLRATLPDLKQDVIEPLHYLPLLEQRPGAFEHAIPVRRWRKRWPKDYEHLLEKMCERWPDGRGVREFIAVLKLHQDHPPERIEKAVRLALELGATHLDGVQLCLRQLQETANTPSPLDLSDHPHLAQIGNQPVNLQQYDQLLGVR